MEAVESRKSAALSPHPNDQPHYSKRNSNIASMDKHVSGSFSFKLPDYKD